MRFILCCFVLGFLFSCSNFVNTADIQERGIEKADKGDYEGAIEDFTLLIDAKPNNATVYIERAFANGVLENYAAAQADLDKALKLDPKSHRAHNNQGILFSDLGEEQKAIESYTIAIDLRPNLATLYHNRGMSYAALEHYEAALADLDAAIELDKSDPDFFYQKGLVYHEMEAFEMAIDEFSSSISLDSTYFDAILSRGDVKDAMEDYVGAIKDYSRYIELYPNSPTGYNNRGYTFNKNKNYDAALQDLDKAIALSPEYDFAYINKGDTKIKLGAPQEAIALYQQALQIDSSFVALKSLASAYELTKDYPAAVDCYRKIMTIDDTYGEDYLARGLLYIKMKEKQKACLDFKTAVALEEEAAVDALKKHCQ